MVQSTRDNNVIPEVVAQPRHIVGGKAASQPSDPDSLYPDGVDPSVADEVHNSRGQWSPYSEKQRKAAAVLIRRYQNKGMNLQEATSRAFEEVGDPAYIDEVTQGRQKDSEPEDNKRIRH